MKIRVALIVAACVIASAAAQAASPENFHKTSAHPRSNLPPDSLGGQC